MLIFKYFCYGACIKERGCWTSSVTRNMMGDSLPSYNCSFLVSLCLDAPLGWSRRMRTAFYFCVFSSNWALGRKYDCGFDKTINCFPILWHGKYVPLSRSWSMTTALYFVQFLLIEPWEGNTITDLTRLLILVHCRESDMESDKTNKTHYVYLESCNMKGATHWLKHTSIHFGFNIV